MNVRSTEQYLTSSQEDYAVSTVTTRQANTSGSLSWEHAVVVVRTSVTNTSLRTPTVIQTVNIVAALPTNMLELRNVSLNCCGQLDLASCCFLRSAQASSADGPGAKCLYDASKSQYPAEAKCVWPASSNNKVWKLQLSWLSIPKESRG